MQFYRSELLTDMVYLAVGHFPIDETFYYKLKQVGHPERKEIFLFSAVVAFNTVTSFPTTLYGLLHISRMSSVAFAKAKTLTVAFSGLFALTTSIMFL
ncbi:unnamed protein product [Protopolystoma xenopodis]|uniref:Uncharacterized protein n=1 Tax=Protopolystoma xenopodis TaxID=117903 RepID=A0A3S5BUX0_9PLAT|nr:unnamed protein product [Protopolystoma xenopodis]